MRKKKKRNMHAKQKQKYASTATDPKKILIPTERNQDENQLSNLQKMKYLANDPARYPQFVKIPCPCMQDPKIHVERN